MNMSGEQRALRASVSLSDEWLDRLVDDELSPEEYRELLRLIAQDPEGWKRCAQAFLEAQAWRKDLAAGALGHEPDPRSLMATAAFENVDRELGLDDDSAYSLPVRGASRSRRGWRSWAGPLTSVAALVIAFAAGLQWAEPPTRTAVDRVESPALSEAAERRAVPAGHMQLAVDGTEGQLEVPYFEPSLYPQAGGDQAIEGFLNRDGVERVRTVMPEQLDESRSVLVPVEVISLPAGKRFQ